MSVELDGVDLDVWLALSEVVRDVDVRVGNHLDSM